MNTDTENIYFGINRIKNTIENSDKINSDRFDDFSITESNDYSPINPLSSTENESRKKSKKNIRSNKEDENVDTYTSVIEPSSAPTIYPKSEFFRSSPKSSQYNLSNNNTNSSERSNYKKKYKLLKDSILKNSGRKYDFSNSSNLSTKSDSYRNNSDYFTENN